MAGSGRWSGPRPRQLSPVEGHRRCEREVPSSLAQMGSPAVIPPVPTEPNQTGLTRVAAQPDLPRPYWTGLSGRWAVISYTAVAGSSPATGTRNRRSVVVLRMAASRRHYRSPSD
jgi:hypothetical protein